MIQYKEKDGLSSYFVNGRTTSFRPGVSFAPGGEYYWTVSAYQSSTDYRGKTSPEWIFYTGSPCAGTSFLAPRPVGRFTYYNKQGVWISPNDALKFEWYYPGDCLPDSYYYEFATDWDFTSILASGVTSSHRQYVEFELPECTSGFWRVAAGNSETHGPFSEKRRFFWVSDEGCWMLHVPSIDMARVHGRVYLDYCPRTSMFSSTGPLPEGCVSSEFGVHGDGIERYWEEGVDSVQVNFRRGSCPDPTEMSITVSPSASLDTAVTDWYGTFEFVVLSPGEYCLTVSKDQADMAVDLSHGLWTEPLTDRNVVYQTITIPEGTHTLTENVGWDEYNYLTLYVEVLTHCQSGDSKAFPPQAFIEKKRVPLLARNQQGTWLKAIVDGVECYFYYQPDSGEEPDGDQPTEEDILDLPVFVSLPISTSTTKPPDGDGGPDCSSYTNVNSCVAAGCTWNWNTQTCTK